ncbi:conserved hypothetical protein [Burkholderiales bacterium 8X]|nr:conserved hypothetical protein [Burkholderiales bacterium 8X]
MAEFEKAISELTNKPIGDFWSMQEGSPICKNSGLIELNGYLAKLSGSEIDSLKGKVAVGLQKNVEVTIECIGALPINVTQVYCGSLEWLEKIKLDVFKPLASLLLEAAYEATLLAAVANQKKGYSDKLALTMLGAGANRIPEAWIIDAMRSALKKIHPRQLQIYLVYRDQVSIEVMNFVKEMAAWFADRSNLQQLPSSVVATGGTATTTTTTTTTATSIPTSTNPTSTSTSTSSMPKASKTLLPVNEQKNWFEKLTGFTESKNNYKKNQKQFVVDGKYLHSLVNQKKYLIGRLRLKSLDSLRESCSKIKENPNGLKFRIVEGDVRDYLGQSKYANAVFQVASQFNLLEMASKNQVPELGITIYAQDKTQGPACAMAAGAATLFRQYCIPMGLEFGQTKDRQINCLADIAEIMKTAIGGPVVSMKNGYAQFPKGAATRIETYFANLGESDRKRLMGKLKVGIHGPVEITSDHLESGHAVTQLLCSALPLQDLDGPEKDLLRPFAQLILDATYEATLLAGLANSRKEADSSKIVFLTLIGGHAFGNREAWILSAIRRALLLLANHSLDVRLISYNTPTEALTKLQSEFQPAKT